MGRGRRSRRRSGPIMVTLVLRYRVADWATFIDVFDAFDTVRQRNGALGHRLLRSIVDTRQVTVLIQFPTEEDATRFLADPERGPALLRAGVDPASHMSDVTELVEDVAY